jgi:hypothetical protein
MPKPLKRIARTPQTTRLLSMLADGGVEKVDMSFLWW